MLKGLARFALAGMAIAQVVGCASYKQGTFPVTDLNPEEKEETVEISVGSEVQIEMTDGEKYSGEVVRVSDSELVIGRASNYGFEERTFQREKIAQVTVRNEAMVSTIAVTTLGVLVFTFVALGVLIGLSGGNAVVS